MCLAVLDSTRPRPGVVEMPIVLSHETEGGIRLCLTHPLSLAGFRTSLAECPEKELIHFVLNGIEHGVRLGLLEGQVDANQYCCHNAKGIVGREGELRVVLMNEVACGCKFGPFSTPLFSSFKCLPANLIPKRNSDKSRLIHNLSHPFAGNC